jgi:hypothetical protein
MAAEDIRDLQRRVRHARPLASAGRLSLFELARDVIERAHDWLIVLVATRV